jgi:FkbM family methyltransferase
VTGRLDLLRAALPRQIHLVDVGAYRGDFTAAALTTFPGSTAMLFEPGPSKAHALRERFRVASGVRVFEMALSDESGQTLLYERTDSATDSLLPYVGEPPDRVRPVRVERLDAILEEEGGPSLDLLKIDAQGGDLRVLKGASKTLARSRPALLVEAIFAPLYEGQASFEEILAFVSSVGYRLAGLHAIHTDPRGLLAFADLLFLAEDAHTRLAAATAAGPFACHDPELLQDQVQALQEACDDRLALIHQLTRAAEERLVLVQRLDAELRRLQGV